MGKIGIAALSALLPSASLAVPALADDHYTGPIIDTHAHLRTDDGNGLSPAHPIGTSAPREPD